MTEQEQHLEPSKRKAYLMALRDLFAARNPSANVFELWWDITTASSEDRITAIDQVLEDADKAAKVLNRIAENAKQYAAP